MRATAAAAAHTNDASQPGEVKEINLGLLAQRLDVGCCAANEWPLKVSEIGFISFSYCKVPSTL